MGVSQTRPRSGGAFPPVVRAQNGRKVRHAGRVSGPDQSHVDTSSDITRILEAASRGDSVATAKLLPIVYDELRSLARSQLKRESPGHTLQPTALVHEAYLRLLVGMNPSFGSRAHFFSAAAQAMRHILVEHARRKAALKRGGHFERVELDDIAFETPPDEILSLNDALDAFAREDERGSQLVTLRYFAGLSMDEVADVMGLSKRTAEREWHYARAWLLEWLHGGESHVDLAER